jgi:hypothetical protein
VDSSNSQYCVYAFPVKLFATYTIAIDSELGVELFCGLYNTSLEDNTDKGKYLIKKTYQKENKTLFNQPFLYKKLSVDFWPDEDENTLLDPATIARCDIINRERDLKLFIKIPASCRSSITVLEGDFRAFNDCVYTNKRVDSDSIEKDLWVYKTNRSILNFNTKDFSHEKNYEPLNNPIFKPIGKIQLLAFNTGESYPFSNRLVEYLSNSAITSNEAIMDNIRRVQKVMNQNGNYFKMEGVWENKIQKIAYDYMMNTGPLKVDNTNHIIDAYRGEHPKLRKSNQYDILGYIDKDVEKKYASWSVINNRVNIQNTIQNVDIYNRLYDLD